MISLKGFKVIHGDKVLNALVMLSFDMPEKFHNFEERPEISKPKFIDVMAINEDGNAVVIHDEAWRFQFVPIVRG